MDIQTSPDRSLAPASSGGSELARIAYLSATYPPAGPVARTRVAPFSSVTSSRGHITLTTSS